MVRACLRALSPNDHANLRRHDWSLARTFFDWPIGHVLPTSFAKGLPALAHTKSVARLEMLSVKDHFRQWDSVPHNRTKFRALPAIYSLSRILFNRDQGNAAHRQRRGEQDQWSRSAFGTEDQNGQENRNENFQ